MTIHLPLIALIAVLGYLGYRLIRPPLWLVTVLLLGGYLSAGSALGPAIDSGTRAGLAVVNGTAGDAKGGGRRPPAPAGPAHGSPAPRKR